MAKRDQFDVVIVGGGLVGAALALALAQSKLEVALIESRRPSFPEAPTLGESDWDARIYAINPGSERFLSEIGAWRELSPGRVTQIRRMQIFGDGGKANISFDALATGVPELAWIVESRELMRALWRRLAAQKNLTVLCPAQCAALSLAGARATLTTDDGTNIGSSLVVGADGANSWVREAAGLAAVDTSYGQLGVVANFSTEYEHEGTAYQWFREEGTLAYLPLPGRRMSIVWSAREDVAHELMALSPEAFCRRVSAAGQHTLGTLRLLAPAQGFPLHLLTVEHKVAPGVALIGDAAHVVHPLAGQGVNLGFADGEALSLALARREAFRGCGDGRLLRRYERERCEQHFALQCVTDGLQRLFSNQNRILRQVRNRGLELADALPVIKNLLAHRALGAS